jgi:glycosyltransferase involved in cell wall biosynthesis
MELIWHEWLAKKSPGHHLWGATDFNKHQIDFEILPYEKFSLLKKISDRIKILGDLDQQLRILLFTGKYDLVYSACQYNTFLLSILRRLGLFKKPIAIVVHHKIKSVFKQKNIFNFFYAGHDVFICLTKSVKEQLIEELHIQKKRIFLLEWGVDLPFYQYKTLNSWQQTQPLIISAGVTYRDYETLMQAVSKQNCYLHIYCTKESRPNFEDFEISSNIDIKYKDDESVDPKVFGSNLYSTKELLPEYRKAIAVAIPLQDKTENLVGLTSLLDAMAMGKPVIMTRNQQIDLDIEKEGIGIWVEPNDVEGWRQAITYLMENPVEAQKMGDRARYLCEEKYNIEKFTQGLAQIFSNLKTKQKNNNK